MALNKNVYYNSAQNYFEINKSIFFLSYEKILILIKNLIF